jgi:hypothetical protein
VFGRDATSSAGSGIKRALDMQWMDLINWFAGGKNSYHTLYHCMHGDTLWIAITVGLDLAVAVGYLLIARSWGESERLIQNVNRAIEEHFHLLWDLRIPFYPDQNVLAGLATL